MPCSAGCQFVRHHRLANQATDSSTHPAPHTPAAPLPVRRHLHPLDLLNFRPPLLTSLSRQLLMFQQLRVPGPTTTWLRHPRQPRPASPRLKIPSFRINTQHAACFRTFLETTPVTKSLRILAAAAACAAAVPAFADHPGGAGNSGGTGPINTISASTIPAGISVASIVYDRIALTL